MHIEELKKKVLTQEKHIEKLEKELREAYKKITGLKIEVKLLKSRTQK